MTTSGFEGVLVPVVTPFDAKLNPDTGRFVNFCRYLLDQGADGLAVFGTTSEANSMSAEERMDLLEALVEGGIPAKTLMPGTGACALTDAVKVSAHAVKHGCGGVLMLPPFYYKIATDDGLFAFYSEVIERVGSSDFKVYLYHIPPVAQVGISLDLIERLIKRYPDTVVGLKDSSGDWSNTKAMLDRFPGFRVFPGSEVFLLDGLRNGAVGCITATGSVNVAEIRKVFTNWQTPEADDLQARITLVRKTIQAFPMIPALKRIIARATDDPAWVTMRPPLMSLPDDKAAELYKALDAIDYAMPAPAKATA